MEIDLIPVEGQKDLYRDLKTNAIVNTNKKDYDAYIMRKNNLKEEKIKFEKMECELSTIKDELNEIKLLLRGLIKNEL